MLPSRISFTDALALRPTGVPPLWGLVGVGRWQVDAKRARRGCLTAPSTLPDGT